jgi:hypothetical protein
LTCAEWKPRGKARANTEARMAKSADAADLKSAGRKAVGVQVPLWAPWLHGIPQPTISCVHRSLPRRGVRIGSAVQLEQLKDWWRDLIQSRKRRVLSFLVFWTICFEGTEMQYRWILLEKLRPRHRHLPWPMNEKPGCSSIRLPFQLQLPSKALELQKSMMPDFAQ